MKAMHDSTHHPLAALALLTACLALLAACTDDALDATGSADGSVADGGLYICCTVADHTSSTYTRASSTEAGWNDDWHENDLSRLDIFIFEQGDFIENVTTYTVTTNTVAIKSVTTSGVTSQVTTTTTLTTTWTVTTKADGTTITSEQTTSTSYYTEAAYQDGDVEGTTNDTIVTSHDSYEYYFKQYAKAASSDSDGSLAINQTLSLEDSNGDVLKGSAIADTDSIYIVANHDFDADATAITGTSTFSDLITAGTLTIDDLKSVNSYLSLDTDNAQQRAKQSSFVMEGRLIGSDVDVVRDPSDYGEETKTINVSLKRALAKICLRAMYKELDASSYEQLSNFSDYGIALKLMHFAPKAAIVEEGLYFPSSADDLTDESEYSSSLNYYYDSSSSDDPDYRAVFYLCPNNWLDSSLVSSMNTTEPIKEEMQTHLMMSITSSTHMSMITYTYKVPINYLLPDDNDAAVPDASYKELYRVDRNHVYNVTVYIAEQEEGFRVYVSTDSDGDADFIDDLTDDSNYIILDEEEVIVGTDDDGPVEDLSEDDDYIITVVGEEDESSSDSDSDS